MEDSILKSTKKTLGLMEDYTAFDLNVIIFINSGFGTLNELGIGPVDGFAIDDDSATWTEYCDQVKLLGMVKTFIYLQTRMLFDPPATSFHIEAMNKQLDELVFRLTVMRDEIVNAVEEVV